MGSDLCYGWQDRVAGSDAEKGSLRGGQGWILNANGQVLVPIDKTSRTVTFSAAIAPQEQP